MPTFFDVESNTQRTTKTQYQVLAAYDISLSVDGEKFQPAPGNPLEVSISNPAISENLRLQVWHIRDDGTGEQIPDFTVEGESVRFPAESFSAYLVVQVTLTTNITAGDGNTYRVSVTYDQDANMPENTDLAVRELGDDEKEDYVNQSAEALGTDAEDFAFARAFDISLTDPDTGDEVQPASGVKVSIALLDTDVSAADELNLLHFGEEVEKVDYTLNGSAVEFETDGFSVYVITGYTVDFHWGDYTYSIAGESEILLSALLEKLGVTEITAADVADVAFSDPALVEVETIKDEAEQTTDWLLRSLAPFHTDEKLTLTLKNGQSVEIKVTDEGEGNEGTGKGAQTFTITWKNADGTVLKTDENVEANTTPSYDGETPTKEADDSGKYYFVGWTPEVMAATADIEYTARFEHCIPLTITAGSDTKDYDGTALTNDSYTNTALADGDQIESVEFHNTITTVGSTINKPENAKIVNSSGEDVTSHYDITYVSGRLTVWSTEAVKIERVAFNGDVASYTITVNPENAVYNNGHPLTLKASFNDEEKNTNGEIIYNKQSIDYASIEIVSEAAEAPTYDYSGNAGTYSIPDSHLVTITYNTRVKGDAGDVVKFYSTVELGFWTETGEYISGPSMRIDETETIAPTGTDISGTGGVYTVDLYVYAENHMEMGLGGAVFRMLDSNKQPMTYKAGENAGKEITFTTGEDGHVLITLNEADHGLSIHKNTVYFLEMITAPFIIKGGEYIYYRRDNTFYNFLISDDPSYQYGEIYTYFNGDTMKVRCYPEGPGVNVTKRFSGNYTLSSEQEKAIQFVLQEEALDTESGWTDVEEHPYSDFQWGTLSFDIAAKGELKANTTYRVIERNTLPAELTGTIDWNQYYSISYQDKNGQPIELDSNEFFVDSENDRSVSFNLVYTNEYVDHKLTIISIDEYSGKSLTGAEFKVYAEGSTDAIAVYTTGEDGSLTICQNDGDGYTPGVLYYAVQTEAADGYLLPTEPERIYFYFTDADSSPDEIPEGATNLTAAYNTVTVANNSDTVSIPVTVVWGNKGSEPWPDTVDHIVIGLYQSAGGATAAPVIKDGAPLTVTLTKEKYYDNSSFRGDLPAMTDDGKLITYSVVEEGIYADAAGNSDISIQFADSSSISGTGWYVVKNEPAVSVTVVKRWYELGGTTISVENTDSKDPVSFDLYRTITEIALPEEGSFTRAALAEALKNAECVRTSVQLAKGEDDKWKTTINSLIEKDTSGNPYFYYVLENPVPDNQEDSYIVAPASGETPRTLTIKNTQTPYTVTITAGNLEKEYGDDDPAFDLHATVKQPDEVDISDSIQEKDGNYTVTVPLPDNSTKTISFTVSREKVNNEEGENVGEYIITPAGSAEQEGYRVLYETGMLTINKATVTVTVGGSKTYGDPIDTEKLVTVDGLKKEGDTVDFTVSREEGEDAGTYPITLSGETDQGNYTVTYVRRDDSGKLYVYTINRADATLRIDDAEKTFGEDDSPFSAAVDEDDMKRGDDQAVVLTEFDLTREEGENVGNYDIMATTKRESATDGEGKTYYILDNYNVYVETGTFTIKPTGLTVTVDDAEKTYGDEDPAWVIELDGLEGEDGNGTLNFTKDETGNLVYTYSVERQITDASGDSGDGEPTTSTQTVALLTFIVTRASDENVGIYDVVPSGEEVQGNYTLTFESGDLQIYPADLTVTPDHLVKAIGVAIDPLLTATVEGWVFDDGDANKAVRSRGEDGEDGTIIWNWIEGEGETAFIVQTLTASKEEDGTITWTYTRRTPVEGEGNVTETVLLTFTLKRAEGETEGEYTVTAVGNETQSNYHVRFEEGEFSILSILDIDVHQTVVDYVDVDANPTYNYIATLDLSGTGLTEYSDNGFEPDEHGVPTLSFALPDTGAEADNANLKTLKVPAGAKLTVTQTASETNDGNYTTVITEDGGACTPGETKNSCVLISDTYHEALFTHTRISFPVSARYSNTQEETGATEMTGRKGAMSIPEGEGHTRSVNTAFAEEMHGKIRFEIPTTKYYDYDHASLYPAKGEAIEGGHNVTAIRYAEKTVEQGGEGTDGTETAKTYVWQYSTDGTSFVDAPDGSQLVLFYLPKDVCKIGTIKFNSISEAVKYAAVNGNSATIEMLIGDYAIRSASDAVTIPENCSITITTATTEYEGTGTAIISRSNSYVGGPLFTNEGKLTFGSIILDGKGIAATSALVDNAVEDAVLTVSENAVLQNARGENGGAIYATNGTVTVSGSVTKNSATNGGAVYVNNGTVTVSGSMSENDGTNGGAVYVNNGTVTVSGSMSGNNAANGGAVYVTNGTVTVSGSMSGNSATGNGGAVYMTGGSFDIAEGAMIGGTTESSGNSAANGGAVYVTSGTVTVSGSMTGNSATSNGGAVYMTDGTVTVSGSMSGNSATANGGAVYQGGGVLYNEGTISGNSASNGGGIYRVGGTLALGGTVSNNSATASGGGVHSNGGTLNVNATLTDNSAADGGAIYVSSATLNINGGSISGNTADASGGAVYALNTATTIDNAAEIGSNTAASLGGALYMEGGSVAVKGESALTENEAANGGAIYATSGSITLGSVTTVKVEETTVTTVTGCSLTENTASGSGGAIYAVSASVNVNVGSVTNNTATTGNGGAICSESGTVTVALSAEAPEGTTLSISGNKAEAGLGGAIYAASGTVNYSGGSITTNSAVNGAAIFAGTGIANISASITGNTATNGGAVGVGDVSARLNFTGDANVYDNKLGDEQRNVCLDVDSELVIQAVTLNSGKKIGVYVPGDVNGDQVVKHGDVTGYFGAYTSDANVKDTFKNDRFGDLKVGYENNRLYWTNALIYDVYYLESYNTGTQFPPNTASPSKAVVTGQSYVPRTRETDIYDLVMAMKLYEKHESNFKNKVGNQYASLAIYAYTYSNKAMSNTFANYLKKVKWDAEERKWVYTKQDGTPAPANTDKIVIFYSSPAYLTIVNNNASGLTLKLSEINVLGYNAAAGLYGYVTAKNGATISTLRTITDEDLELNAGESIKLMFPGAQSQGITLRGTMSGEGATYTFKGGTEQTVSGTAFELNGTLNANDTAAELLFGSELPICKVGDEPFSTLKDAMAYAVAQKAATDNNTYTIEMLVDYLVPAGDVLEIPAGYDITFTTASRDDETLPYTGNGTRATLSRDTGNSGASVTVKNSILTVINLAFDGRSLTAGGAGGAISADNVATVTITNCEFKGYRADWGGAIFAGNKDSGSPENTKLTIEKCQFSNCQTNGSVDKAGGGAIWTTARELYVRNCSFEDCACLQGSAQAGAVFHNIRGSWFTKSKTEITNCTFKNCFSAKASGGTVESDAADITIQNCSFEGSYSSKPSGSNGGALNVYAGDTAATSADCVLKVINCTFKDCNAKLGTANGGAIRTTTKRLLLQGCKFTNVQSVTGGAVSMTNGNATKLEIYGCTFENCIATGNGGAVSASVPTVILGTNADIPAEYGITPSKVFFDGTENDGSNHFVDCNANLGGGIYNAKTNATVSLKNVSFTRCEAKTDSGGALYTQAKTLSVTGSSNIFTNCIAQNSGGAIFQNINKATGSSMRLENCVFTGCESKAGDGNGGGMYTNAKTLVISGTGNSFNNCSATNSGGGLFHSFSGDGDTFTIGNCGFDNCIAKAGSGGGLYTNTHSLTITGANSKFKDCTAQTNGGGLYHNQNATGTTFTFQDGNFENCTATGDYGGAIYSPAKTVTLKDATVSDSKAKAQGGGVWFSPTTATISGCTITGNSVSNSDSKGGGVYLGGGTTEYKSGIVSGCSAANGGGWYQTDGTLNILGGVITGNATNGGGIYQAKGTINQYGGAVAGTATANGGGVYKSGTYSLGNGTYNIEYNGGASIGGRITLPVIINGEETTKTVDSLAVNGGGVYNAGGTLTLNAGGSIGSAEPDAEGETVYVSTAMSNGGGVYIGGGALRINGGVITNCQASGDGGGVYFASSGSNNDFFFYGDNDTKIQNCRAANGGGVWLNSNTFHIGEKDKSSLGTIENCHASVNGGGLYQANGIVNLRNTSIIQGCSASVNGGGVYHAGGTFNIYVEGCIKDCTAKANGGGVYNAGGTFTFEGGSIIRNEATENGGGVYHMGGTFSMTAKGAVIGGSEGNGNTANVGAGIFVADGQAATFNDNNFKTLEISYNHALTEGGGIAVGGPNAVLTFQGTVTVRHNTMGMTDTECNVYLDQDRNAVIKNNALNAGSYIGVYASDVQNAGHGLPGMPFATYSNENNLNSYHNDRLRYLYGMKGSNSLVIWPEFVCKITDGYGNLLYKDADGTPAVYSELENRANSKNNTAGAFTVLNVPGTPVLYQRNEDGTYTQYNADGTGEYQVQMLVPNYTMGSTRQIKLDAAAARKVTLTTASTTEDECGFKYTGDSRFSATITRTADTSCMIFVGGNNGWELDLRNITMDGGNQKASEEGAILRVVNTGKVILDSVATLQNGGTNDKAGGAVYVDNTGSLTMNAGSQIKGCSAGTSNGGAVAVNNGTFTMNGGSITSCSAANGGGVYVTNSGKIFMNGGTIGGTGEGKANTATNGGGGISLNNDNSRITFSGLCNVTGNTLNGTRCNVQLNQDSNAIINANDLDGKSEIGVYVPNGANNYDKHGKSGKSFGTYTFKGDKVYCFVNDRHTDLRGVEGANDDWIYWEKHFLLRVSKAVESDWAYDNEDAVFTFTVEVDDPGSGFSRLSNPYGDMDFNQSGNASITLKAGESKTAIFPAQVPNFENMAYTVKEMLTTGTDGQEVDYTTKARQNGGEAAVTYTVTGRLGEMLSEIENSSGLSDVVFTNTRVTGDLTVSKTVVSAVESDLEGEFTFTLTLDPASANKISKTYDTKLTTKDDDGTETSENGSITFANGVAIFTLKNNQALTVNGLPTDLPYTVTENLTEDQSAKIRTQMKKDGSELSYSTERKQSGKIGESPTIVTEGEGEETKQTVIYNSNVEFINTFQKIVCKITNRNRVLLYYREANGTLQPAIFSHLEDAFDQINSGNLRTSSNGTVSGPMRIEMVVPEYTMERQATLNSGKNVTLTTALTTDTDHYPYNDGESDEKGNVAAVYRGFVDGSMIVDNGNLTIDKITLDGRNRQVTISESDGETVSYNAVTAQADGGIVQVNSAVTLTVTGAATLQNAATDGDGGAIWLHSGATLTMNGTISNCNATGNGGGVYADAGFKSITATGSIADCTAANGGAIYASTGNGVTLNTGAELTGNSAIGTTVTDNVTGESTVIGGNGGAVYSEANVTLRGRVGGTDEGNSNTASGNGGGFYMGPNATYIMYAGGEVIGNKAQNGGGLAVQNTAANSTRFPGGVLKNNEATQNGGAVYAAEDALVAVSGAAEFTENSAAVGGAIYGGGVLSMTGGSMTGNSATQEGGAVYVASGKTFTMTGGSIKEGNKSNEGAVSTGSAAVLTFSGNAVVTGNTGTDGDTPMNVWLGYDSNSIITSNGLGANAKIGVYVADGEPEPSDPADPDYREDHVDNPIYADHGVGGRNFATYTGSNIGSARLNKFVNDRDNELYGMSGAKDESSNNYLIAWIGKGLQLKVTQYLIMTDSNGKPVLDEDGGPVLSDKVVPVQNAIFTFTNVSNDEGPVWSGKSNMDGIVSIPWGGNETLYGDIASFVPGSKYILKQTAADSKTVLPAGQWSVTVKRDNSVEWTTVGVTDDPVDRTLAIALPTKAVLGETFGLSNDVKPTMTFDVNDNGSTAKLANNEKTKKEAVPFKTTDTSKDYAITEINPTWDSHVFKTWSTMAEKPTGDGGEELNETELKAKGYFEYAQTNNITFYRGTDSVEPAVKYAQNLSKGDMTLYAQWEEVVCKITDRNGTLLYINGSPAVYATLEEGFAAYNLYRDRIDFKYASGSPASARRIEMLVGEYTLQASEGVALNRGKTALFTTAPSTDTDGYSYTGVPGTVCTIYRGACDTSMISVGTNLTLTNITLDAKKLDDADVEKTIACDGGIVSVGIIGNDVYGEAVLTVGAGATLRNSLVTGYGGAINAGESCTVSVNGGIITNNTAAFGGALYVDRNGTARIQGGTISDNTAANGGAVYICENSALTVTRGNIIDNSASNNNGDVSFGGGIYVDINASATISGGAINRNKATNGGAVYVGENSEITVSGGTISENKATGNGGALHVETDGVAKIQGGTYTANEAANGGAVYVEASATATVSGGTISGNSAANGAGIYLVWNSANNHAVLNLSGNPSFGGTGVENDVLVTRYKNEDTAGNFVTWTYAADANEKNGGKNYINVRQDIYIPGTATPHKAIRVTGKIASGDGTIWVWAEHVNHYEMLKQFAVIADGVTIDENTYKAFRNAQPDSLTNCGGDYLTGQKGDDVNGWKCIYWTGGFDVVFKKIDGYGKPLPGATFTLYSDPACTTPFEMTFTGSTPVTGDGKRATTVSSDGTATYKDKNGSIVTLEKGEVLLSKVPPKTFYLKETVVPAKDPEGKDHIYKLDETIYEVKISGTGELEMHKKSSSTATSYDVEVFKVKTSTDPAPEVWQYQVMNVSKAERKVILRKVAEENKTIRSLPGAVFQIERFDGMLIESTDINGNKTTTFTSSASGVYFIDKLPYGVYYLFEKTAPTGYASGKWFTLTVSNDNANGSRDGVTVAEITDAALLTRLNQSIENS